MSTDKIGKYLTIIQDEISMRMVNFMKSSHTTEEVINEIWTYLRNRYPSLYNERLKAASVVAARLGSLEQMGAVEYSEGKWQTTEQFTQILSKYFGL